MNPWIRKEVRLLFPNFVVGLLLILVAWLLPSEQHFGPWTLLAGVPLLLCPVILLLMSLDAFGREITTGMFSTLLSQPVARERIWWTKTLLLVVCSGLLWWGWWTAFLLHASGQLSADGLSSVRNVSILYVAVVVAGGLWTVLAFRQVTAALVITVLTPFGLIMISFWLLESRTDHLNVVLAIILAVYAFAGILWAYRHFLRFEDSRSFQEAVDFSQGSLRLPSFLRSWSPAQSSGLRRALVWKEVNLLHGVLVLAATMAVVHLGVVGLRLWVKGAYLRSHPDLEMVLSGFWGLWLIFPLLIGAAVFAEERRLGVWESQLCLAVSRRQQCVVKGLVGLMLALCLGAAMPVLFESNRLLQDSRYDLVSILQEAELLGRGGLSPRAMRVLAKVVHALPFDPQPLLLLAVISTALLLLSTFTSSLSRSLLQSLSAAVGGLFVLALLLFWLEMPLSGSLLNVGLFRGPLGILILIPMLVITMIWLISGNARQIWVGRRQWWRNALVLLAVFLGGSAATAMIYHRVWERQTPSEPVPGTAVLRLADRVQLQKRWDAIAIKTADGRSWGAALLKESDDWRHAQPLVEPIARLQGSNWANIALCAYETVGIQDDGSLWVSANPLRRSNPAEPDYRTREASSRMLQFGTDQDWKHAVPFRSGALLLKTNGTLWMWEQKVIRSLNDYQGLIRVPPHQTSPDTDWAELELKTDQLNLADFVIRKKNGRAWASEGYPISVEAISLDDRTRLCRTEHLDSDRPSRYAELCTVEVLEALFQVAIGTNGHLAVNGVWEQLHKPIGQRPLWGWRRSHIPLNDQRDSLWQGLASDHETLVSLRSDGTLWKWNFPALPAEASQKARSTRLGTRSDWVALSSFGFDIISLAADGSLWSWQFERRGNRTFLAPSEKPLYLGNILK